MGNSNPRTMNGQSGYWTRWYVLGVPIYSKFVTKVVADSGMYLLK